MFFKKMLKVVLKTFIGDYSFNFKLKTIFNNYSFNFKKFKTVINNYGFNLEKEGNQISAPTPCCGNPSSTVTSLLVFLTEALIADLSRGRIERRFMTCIKQNNNLLSLME